VLTFFAIVSAIYVSECACWVENGAVLLTGLRKKRWRARVGPMLAMGRKGGFSMIPPWPPLSTATSWPGAMSIERGIDLDLSPRVRKEAAKTIERFYSVAEPLWIGSNAFWIFLFCVAPAIVYWRGLAATWPTLLLCGLAILGFILHMFWRAYGALFPDAAADRRSKTLLMGLSPLGAIRAVDHLAWRLLAGIHPLVAAVELCDRADAVRLARLMYFGPPNRDERIRRFLEQSDLWDAVVAAPAGEPGATAFCPRCHAQYIRADGECSDCSGVVLVPRAGLCKPC
jgi:hypothetical protein